LDIFKRELLIKVSVKLKYKAKIFVQVFPTYKNYLISLL